MTLLVRLAGPVDIEALVALRMENGRVHAALDPVVYRVPEADAVREHFASRLASQPTDEALLVAVVDGEVVGLAEVSIDPPAPRDQVLQPMSSAHVHLVVLEQGRGRGVGRELAAAVEQWAQSHSVRQLVAGIEASNQPGLGFYRGLGYREHAVIRLKDVAGQ